MADTNYLRSVAEQTPTAWWHDSGDPGELERETMIEQLRKISEFEGAFEPDGMAPEEFITFGVTRKTLTQFYHNGWALLKNYEG
jgi:hypothetical protein